MLNHLKTQKSTIFTAGVTRVAQARGLTLAFLSLTLAGLPGCRQAPTADRGELLKAKQLIAQGNYPEAFMQLNQVLAEAPQDPDVHLNLGFLYLYSNDVSRAEKELGKASELAPERAETLHLKGALLSYRAQREKSARALHREQKEAIALFRQSLQRDPRNYQTYFDLATALTALNREEEALGVLDQGFEHIPPKDLETQVNFQIASCAAHARLQMFEDAIADCEQARKFTTNPASSARIEEMVQNMRLMNPALGKGLTPADAPPEGSPEARAAKQQAEETEAVNEAASD